MPSKLSNSFLALGCLSPIIGVSLFIYLLVNKSILSAFVYLGVFAVVMIILMVIGSLIEDNRKAKQRRILSTLLPDVGNYHETQSYVAYDLLSKIAVDEKNMRMYFWAPENNEVQSIKDASYGMSYRIFDYPYSAVLAVQIIEDNAVSRQSQSARSLLDGLEPINDGHTKKTSNNDRIHSMELKLIMKDKVRPIHIVRYYTDSSSTLNKGTPEYRRTQNDIEQWFTILHFIIRETDQKEGYNHAPEDEIQQPRFFSQSKLENDEIEVRSSVHDENKALVKAQLLFVLNQVIYKKILDSSIPKKNDETLKPQDNSTSYFDKLLEKNREQLRSKPIDE